MELIPTFQKLTLREACSHGEYHGFSVCKSLQNIHESFCIHFIIRNQLQCSFPIGGDTMSVTSGVVSRIEVTSYTHGATALLGMQIDAGNSSRVPHYLLDFTPTLASKLMC